MVDEYLFDVSPRNENGAKTRIDGGGDAWANAHRIELGPKYFMQDVDVSFGPLVFGQNSGERLFLEYVPDDYQNREKTVRRFAVVAMFDRKSTLHCAMSNRNRVSAAFYLWQCRTFAAAQPVAPKFFYVTGDHVPPWTMYEVDIETGDVSETGMDMSTGTWERLWASLGLIDQRNALSRWLNR